MLVDSFRRMRYIDETLVIFSHDFYSQDVFDVIAKIDFCPYVQIFYPYAIQVYNNQFPGDDPKDCPRNLKKEEARKRKCNNAEYQHTYGHYREAPYTQIKHHLLWKLQFIFENCSLLRTNISNRRRLLFGGGYDRLHEKAGPAG
ncbi:alpha-1,6-mannosyl-glycoprotein 2-beta-N-acetylglucosaminyltransferase-like [Gigantopelta aegis]|uniref:alpha-1,6-mannosyl-glycoprotein 2-beta-N-acetylglucosaminyltransferase-like n=1 Tax=Gigantopelta aegis TaxID=1735272 RepID=UPI001B88742F|nr:alpha-1,6-mannosyl-glycoprotein 2-beta-N-acetylglucosaminyltransferase-like [Gigantopelta aegis]